MTNGTLTLSGTVGLTFEAGADGTSSMTVTGLESAINAALEGLTYTPDADYHGPADLQITTSLAEVSDAGLWPTTASRTRATPGNDDSASGSNDGTVLGGATPVFDASRGGNVLSFDGFDDSVRISGLFGEPSSVTLAAWVNLDGGFFDNEVLSIGNNISLRLDDTIAGNGVTGFFWDGGAWRHTDSNVFINGTGWHHVAFTFDDANDLQAIYVDGVGGTPRPAAGRSFTTSGAIPTWDVTGPARRSSCTGCSTTCASTIARCRRARSRRCSTPRQVTRTTSPSPSTR